MTEIRCEPEEEGTNLRRPVCYECETRQRATLTVQVPLSSSHLSVPKRPGVRFLNTKASVDTAPVNWKDDVKEISFDIVMTVGFVGVLWFDPKSN
jgi:hypothetical protein